MLFGLFQSCADFVSICKESLNPVDCDHVSGHCTMPLTDGWFPSFFHPWPCTAVLICSWVFYNAVPGAEFVPQRLFCNNLSHAYFIWANQLKWEETGAWNMLCLLSGAAALNYVCRNAASVCQAPCSGCSLGSPSSQSPWARHQNLRPQKAQ